MDLDARYAALPALACQGRCQAACGPITATPPERDRILRRHHRVLRNQPGRPCRLLTPEGTCAVYPDRPLICRLYGVVPSMRCPHGCAPTRWLTEAEASAVMQELLRG